MKPTYTILIVLALAGCQSLPTGDRGSIWYSLPPGTRLDLNRPLTIPAQRAHVMLQHGAVLPAADSREVACRFEVRDLGPRVIEPDSFLITDYSSQREWEHHPYSRRYYKTLRLKSERQAGILPMVCEYFDWPELGRAVTQAAIEEALGDYFTFRYPGTP